MKPLIAALGVLGVTIILGGCHTVSGQESPSAQELSNDQKYALAYMWNEEKLAKDLYLALDALWGEDPLKKIAVNAETTHEAMIETLVEQYDINITNLSDYGRAYSEAELRALAPGEFAIPALQKLYEDLYAKGAASPQEALEVGCMVEMTDIGDLDNYIAVAEGFDDIVATFKTLRDDSYRHYNAFDTSLKNMGVTEGCCILGSTYCLNP
jgi:hypothetical protein